MKVFQLSIRIDEETDKKLRMLAKSLRKTKSQIVRHLIMTGQVKSKLGEVKFSESPPLRREDISDDEI